VSDARVAAIVPARNEATRIAGTVRALRGIGALHEVVVVDDASTDDTARTAEHEGARVLRLPRRAGKGGALTAGLAATANADVVVFVDADLGASARVAEALLAPVLAGEADMTVACPPASAPSGFGLVEKAARAGIRALTGKTFRRPLSGQRALRREVAARVTLAAGFGIEPALTIDALRAGFVVVEVEAAVEHRRTGRDAAGFAHRARQGLDLVAVLTARALRRS
jgi:glycosyltransferase involved in cell wall biosynthesis